MVKIQGVEITLAAADEHESVWVDLLSADVGTLDLVRASAGV
jgi:hypothetical protein